MKRMILALVLAAGSVGFGAYAAEVPETAPATVVQMGGEKDPIEVCFVLDTTGSMSGLIEGAKQKIWSIANDIVKTNPKRPLKIGLVAYRDRGDEYVTKVVDLTDDLDGMYKELMAFKADGGGDEPESVNQALQDAVEKVSWSKKGATKVIFLVGDAPPHMDYADDVKYPKILEKAVKQDLIINTIQCGSIASTTPVWKEIATSGEGTYLALAQSGGMVAISAPQDGRLVELNAELAKTVVPYGEARQQAEVNSKAGSFATLAPEAAAARASVNNATGGRAVQGQGDLVQDMQSDKDLAARVKEAELPENMKKMTPKERQKYLDEQLKKRNEINAEIAKVAAERDAYIKQENAKLATKGDPFDVKVSEVIKDEASRARK